MEWSGVQQFSVLYKTAVVGYAIGMLLDIFGGFWRGKAYRLHLLVSDIIICGIAAFVTFFAALCVSDGHFHPVLFVGILCGAVAEHYTIGRWLAWLACKIHKFSVRSAERFALTTADLRAYLMRVTIKNYGNEAENEKS